jgi:type IV pilus assembly protein PilN
MWLGAQEIRSMIRINLLPHREEKRKQRRQQFFVVSALMVALGAAVGLLGHTYMAGNIERQERKNAIFEAEIASLDKEIAEIKRLREQIDALVARKQVIEALQGNRAESVHVFNELVHRMPEGVYLRALKQSGTRVALSGYAQSNSRVSNLMRGLDESPQLELPDLVEVKSAIKDERRLSDFTLNISIERAKTDDMEGAPK